MNNLKTSTFLRLIKPAILRRKKEGIVEKCTQNYWDVNLKYLVRFESKDVKIIS